MEKKILSKIFQAMKEFSMIAPNDHLALGLSGGKDSWALLYLLKKIEKRLPFVLRITAVHIQTADYSIEKMATECRNWGIDFYVLKKDIGKYASQSLRPGSTFCSFCARIKRGAIYEAGENIGANKIVLAHHREDILETIFLNMFYNGQLKGMSPKYTSDRGHFQIIRPLVYVPENWLIQFQESMQFSLVDYVCPHVRDKDGGERLRMKKLLASLEVQFPQLKKKMLASLTNVVPSHLLDKDLHDFTQ